MTVSLTNAARSAAADAVVDLVDAGDSAGQLRIYAGTPPADAGTALTDQTLLATLAMSDPAFGAASNGVATADTITEEASADATGTASFCRVGSVNAGTFTAIWQGSVGTSGADLNLVSTSIAETQPVQVTSLTYTQG